MAENRSIFVAKNAPKKRTSRAMTSLRHEESEKIGQWKRLSQVSLSNDAKKSAMKSKKKLPASWQSVKKKA
jgi:hypothetical protein